MKSLFDPLEPDLSVLSREDANALGQKVFGMSTATRTALSIVNRVANHTRFAMGDVSHAGSTSQLSVSISSTVGAKIGKISTNRTDDAGLLAAIRQAELMATYHRLPRNAPSTGAGEPRGTSAAGVASPRGHADEHDDDDEHSHSAREYLKPVLWFDSTARSAQAEHRAQVVRYAIERARDAKCTASGFIQLSGYSLSMMSTGGLFAHAGVSNGYLSVTARTADGTGSGWAGKTYEDWSRVNPDAVVARAVDIAQRARNPVAVEPGRYTVVLEAAAVGTLLSYVMQALDAEMADHGRSPFSRPGGGNRIGERVMDERLTILADPMDPDGGFIPFDDHGQPLRRTTWVENGILKNLSYEEGYARSKGVEPLANSEAGRMMGGEPATVEEMIASTKHGLYVNRLSSVAVFHTPSLMLSGTTRDGIFLIQDGKITKPVKNFRFNESPLFVFNKVDMIGIPERVAIPGAPIVVPPLKVRDFEMTSLTDAI